MEYSINKRQIYVLQANMHLGGLVGTLIIKRVKSRKLEKAISIKVLPTREKDLPLREA